MTPKLSFLGKLVAFGERHPAILLALAALGLPALLAWMAFKLSGAPQGTFYAFATFSVLALAYAVLIVKLVLEHLNDQESRHDGG